MGVASGRKEGSTNKCSSVLILQVKIILEEIDLTWYLTLEKSEMLQKLTSCFLAKERIHSHLSNMNLDVMHQ